MKRAIVFGSSGQAGSYLVELLESKGYDVEGVDSSEIDFGDENFNAELEIHRVLKQVEPDEVYNFAGKQYAPDSWNAPAEYVSVNGTVVLTILELLVNLFPKTKFFNAGSAEMFDRLSLVQSEDTARKPENPYGLAKMFAYDAVRIYRARGLFACTGVFFNMESPRRKKTFFAEKVVVEAVRIKREYDRLGTFIPMRLERLDAHRDWGWAPEYVEVAWKMLQQSEPDDFVIGTGESWRCNTYVQTVLEAVGLEPDSTEGWFKYYTYEKSRGRFANTMQANPEKAKKKLGWEAKYKMRDVVKMLVEAEMLTKVDNGKSDTVRQS